ncbi:esterase YqiA [Pseudomaricurvus alcaniphilus]|uniref:YqiA/YcfP family alpha/beta fold hydrolase n=1 Tax=Pseudomaricurvus alcaniphilus TaxID=1166482 RepID=UPI00140B7CD6|nr:YqiA/YcfP family alpha/beta fold hydrolase [Pseudomaricurvus alcaniphilus]NHN37091.1 esterase YqiA [Pseudomaricurvus alcaniphilus]
MAAIVYIHGFLSSPGSVKAEQTRAWLREQRPDVRYYCPYLSPYPEQTQTQLLDLLATIDDPDIGLIGSSLGGFWSTWLVEKLGLRAVLINPSVSPHLLIERVKDIPQHNYHTRDSYVMTSAHAAQFRALEPEVLQYPQHYWLLAQEGDETLDYRQAVRRYRGCRQTIEPGGDHAFQGYVDKLPAIVEFLLPPVAG